MTKTDTATEQEQEWVPDGNDRCDVDCPSQAWVKAIGVEGELMFCGHHYNRVKDTITKYAYLVIDKTDMLAENRSKGENV